MGTEDGLGEWEGGSLTYGRERVHLDSLSLWSATLLDSQFMMHLSPLLFSSQASGQSLAS